MEWGKGLDTVVDTMAAKVYSDPPGGVELICQWSANDVYGNFGYMEYTWRPSRSC